MIRNLYVLGTLLLISTMAPAQIDRIENFVHLYREIAIEEMHRTGIPASIKLAQAILESEAGHSELATHSNNFFGLKCGVGWDGGTYYKRDDDYDRRGRLVKSCFRVFDTPQASFIAHSEFLMHPKKAYRYGFLFNLDRYDYKSWAWGLKESGYATNPRYAQLLISIIQKHSLYTYDYYQVAPVLAMATNSETSTKPTYRSQPIEHRTIHTALWKNRVRSDQVIDGVVTNNGRAMVYARQGDTPRSLAQRYGRTLRDIVDFNEEITDAGQRLDMADRVYLQKKRKAYRGQKRFHQVEQGQSMYEISQIYGIILDKLYVRNRMYPGSEPAEGEKIQLRGMVRYKDKPKLRSAYRLNQPAKSSPIQVNAEKVNTHRVEKGDTLYRIATQYRTSVNELRRVNALDSNIIKPGQVLIIGS